MYLWLSTGRFSTKENQCEIYKLNVSICPLPENWFDLLDLGNEVKVNSLYGAFLKQKGQ